jgi:hypothetical protein
VKTALVILFMLSIRTGALCQEKNVWTQEEINEAREGIKYEGTPETIEKQQKPPASNTKESEPTQIEEPPSPFWQSVSRFFSSAAGKMIVFVIIISLLIYAIYSFIQRNKRVTNLKVVSLGEQELQDLENNLVETDIDKFLRLALESKNYKLAVRLLYLGVLQNLHEAELIIWKKEKTNRDYLSEMRQHRAYSELRELTLAFDIVWYGDTEIPESTYHQLSQAFKSFNDVISAKK